MYRPGAIRYSIWLRTGTNIPWYFVIGFVSIMKVCAYLSHVFVSLFIYYNSELWIVCVGLGLLGVAIGCGIVPTFLDSLGSAL